MCVFFLPAIPLETFEEDYAKLKAKLQIKYAYENAKRKQRETGFKRANPDEAPLQLDDEGALEFLEDFSSAGKTYIYYACTIMKKQASQMRFLL